MSKGLEALKEYKSQQQGVNVYADEYLDIIEKELKEWDYFDNELKKYHITKPFLKQFLDLLSICNSENGVNLVKFITENNVYDFQKRLKALEIIKEKNVWFWVFRRTHNVSEYNELVASYYSECAELTQEEYDLLKEVLL